MVEKLHVFHLTDRLAKRAVFTFAKFADGEILCAMKKKGRNCDRHPYSNELGHLLLDAFRFFVTNPPEHRQGAR